MPWVRVDDRFPSHRKVALLSDRAFRLYVSALCWCSENLTEGRILDRELPLVAPRMRGAKRAAADLEEVGLWDRIADGWMVHDYLEYNPDRARVKAEREANAARQKAYRDRKRAEREAKKAAEEEAARNGDRNAPRNGVTGGLSSAGNDASATRTRHDDDSYAAVTCAENQRESQVSGIRNAVSNGTPSRPVLPSPSEKEKEVSQLATRARTEAPSRIGDQPRIPDASQPLIDALTAAGMIVGWDLAAGEWLLIESLISRCGIPALVVSARGSWEGARQQPRSGRYFLPAWRQIPGTPAAQPQHLPEAVGGSVTHLAAARSQKPATSDLRTQQALDVGRRLQAAADAQNRENQ
ncbi:hypothetical protein [Streptomyces albidoflavus]|uniref:hypothetical protein n=1 Tax=Streptomyces albidoflavus TaxID=1886 RepID=UPI003866F844|nr:hypothetical protein OG525_23950 [Streptomyces albidoflavus]